MTLKRRKAIVKSLSVFALICFFNACQAPPKPEVAEPLKQEPVKQVERIESEPEIIPNIPEKEVLPPPKPRPLVHKVRWPGEMLTYIAKWYTGSINNWRAIAAANPKLKPHWIFIGDEIIIPEELVKTRKPMPRDYIPSTQEIEILPPPTSQPKDEAVDIELFGPVDIDQKPPESKKTNELNPE